MSDNDKDGVVKAEAAFPCPYCGKDDKGFPKTLCSSMDEFEDHMRLAHPDRMKRIEPGLPPKVREELDKLLQPPQKGGLGCTSWTLVTLDPKGGVRLTSSIIPRGQTSIEQMMAIEGLMMLLAENRIVLSGRQPRTG